MPSPKRTYADLPEHLQALEKAGLLQRIDEPVNKDTELHPLVRWQFRGGIPVKDRKAFLFTNIIDSKGRAYDMPVAVGSLAATPEIYGIGMGQPLDKINKAWQDAVANPIPPAEVQEAPCQEIVITGKELLGDGNGLDAFPVPISTPGFDSAPYFTNTNCITRDPDDGTQNMGTYRAGLKDSHRLGVRMSSRIGGADGYQHWLKYKARQAKMPCAIVVGCPPLVNYCSPAKFQHGMDELAIAGGLAGGPINIVKAKTVDLMVPAEAEIVIEGLIATDHLEPEGPFGESHGYVALEAYNMAFEVTAITRKTKAVLPSIISQVTPSESSVIRRTAQQSVFLSHLQDNLGIQGIKGLVMHEPLTSVLRFIIVIMEQGAAKTEIWRALYGAANYRADCAKFVIAVNDDIDPDNPDSIFWAMAYRSNPAEDAAILPFRAPGHGPDADTRPDPDSTLLINATMESVMPPLALPKKKYMENAAKIWEELGLPTLRPEIPWHGYELGNWTEYWDKMAERAAAGLYAKNGSLTAQRIRKGLIPETPTDQVPDDR
ncbi:MAG: carboxylase [Rhodospirillaceae bacterium]|nr:carboxylase [Rhodospirillaceae bacterium]